MTDRRRTLRPRPTKTGKPAPEPLPATTVRPEVKFDDKGVLILPKVPKHDKPVEMCLWLTAVFNLDTTHPIDGGRLSGNRRARSHT